MGARSDFWLKVHELTLCLEVEGKATEERRANVLESLQELPPTARKEIVRELHFVLAELSAIAAATSLPPSPGRGQ
jgi:hypothetical protein